MNTQTNACVLLSQRQRGVELDAVFTQVDPEPHVA